MARDRMEIEEWELYVPDVDDERHLFVDHPDQAITMELKFLSKREREHFLRVALKAEKGPEQRRRADSDLRRMFEDHIRGVSNVKVAGVPATTGGDLYDTDEEDIKLDVSRALMSIGRLEEGLAKKLKSLSATSSSQRMSSEDGDAPDAIPA